MRPLLALLVLLLVPAAAAQDDPDRPVLPDIAPREVEITGQLEIAFPSLRRQPLVGFNPPPRVTPIPENRRPYTESYDDARAALPITPLAPPQPPPISALAGRTPQSGEVEFGAGRYLTRRVRLRAEAPVSDEAAVYGAFDYLGTDGHEPYPEEEDLTSASDALEGMAGVQAHTGSLQVGAVVDGAFDRYSLFGAGAPADTSFLDQPERTGRSLGAAVYLRSRSSSALHGRGRIHLGRTSYETKVLDADDAPPTPFDIEPFDIEEQRLTAEGALGFPFGTNEGLVDLRFTAAGLDGDAVTDPTVSLLDAGGRVRLRYEGSFDVAVGARVMTFTRPDEADLDRDERRTFVAPDVRIDLYVGTGRSLYIQNRPVAEANGLADLYRRNPYLVAAPEIEPTISTLDAEAGGTFIAGPVEVGLHAGYRQLPNFLFFEHASRDEAAGYGRGFTATRYAEAEIMHAGGSLSFVLPGGLQATVRADYRDGKLSEDDTIIPYFGPIVGSGMLSFAFDGGRGLVQALATYERARYRDRMESRKIGDFFDLDVMAAYELQDGIGLVARVENISADRLERWERYLLAPFVVTGGVRLLW